MGSSCDFTILRSLTVTVSLLPTCYLCYSCSVIAFATGLESDSGPMRTGKLGWKKEQKDQRSIMHNGNFVNLR